MTQEHSPTVNVAQLCRATDWPMHERSDGRVAVDLELSTGFAQADIRIVGETIWVSVALLDEVPSSGTCRAAIELLVHRLTGAAPALRAAWPTRASAELRLEISLCATLEPAELANTFAVLSVAHSRTAREAALLSCDPRVASIYLAAASVAVPPLSPRDVILDTQRAVPLLGSPLTTSVMLVPSNHTAERRLNAKEIQ